MVTLDLEGGSEANIVCTWCSICTYADEVRARIGKRSRSQLCPDLRHDQDGLQPNLPGKLGSESEFAAARLYASRWLSCNGACWRNEFPILIHSQYTGLIRVVGECIHLDEKRAIRKLAVVSNR